MDRNGIEQVLRKVLRHIQKAGNHPAPDLKGTACPLEDLEGFDSPIAVVATGLLASELGVPIPNDTNVFVASKGKGKLTIDETVDALQQLAATHKSTTTLSKGEEVIR